MVRTHPFIHEWMLPPFAKAPCFPGLTLHTDQKDRSQRSLTGNCFANSIPWTLALGIFAKPWAWAHLNTPHIHLLLMVFPAFIKNDRLFPLCLTQRLNTTCTENCIHKLLKLTILFIQGRQCPCLLWWCHINTLKLEALHFQRDFAQSRLQYVVLTLIMPIDPSFSYRS